MRLYMHPASPNCMAIMMVASQLGRSLETQFVDLMKGDNARTEFLSVNPNGYVPTLIDGEFVLWETIAILQYLAASTGDTPLWPRDEQKRADIARWQTWSLAHWTPALQSFIFQNLFKKMRGMGDPDPAAIAEGETKLERFGGVLNNHLSGRRFATGDQLTLADISLAAYLIYARQAHIPVERFPNVARWYDTVAATPSWKASHP
jgi:glutathione S-transferase